MTDHHAHDQPTPGADLDDPKALQRFLAAYRPKSVEPSTWDGISPAAAALVMRAGAPTRLRVEKDIQLLGALVAHLVDRGRPITLTEALSDTTLLSYDSSLRASEKTREKGESPGVVGFEGQRRGCVT